MELTAGRACRRSERGTLARSTGRSRGTGPLSSPPASSQVSRSASRVSQGPSPCRRAPAPRFPSGHVTTPFPLKGKRGSGCLLLMVCHLVGQEWKARGRTALPARGSPRHTPSYLRRSSVVPVMGPVSSTRGSSAGEGMRSGAGAPRAPCLAGCYPREGGDRVPSARASGRLSRIIPAGAGSVAPRLPDSPPRTAARRCPGRAPQSSMR